MKKLIIALLVLFGCATSQVDEYVSPGNLLRAGVSDNDVASYIQHNHKLAMGMHLPIIAKVCGEVEVVENDRWLWICSPTNQLIRVSPDGEIIETTDRKTKDSK